MSDKDVKEAVEGTLKLFPAADQHALIVCAELMDIELSKSQAANQQLIKALEYSCDYLDENKLNSIGSGSKAHMEMKEAITNAKQQEKGDE